MKIEVDVFDDGKDPVTCARDFREAKGICPMLMNARMGTVECCRLFADNLGGKRSDVLERQTKVDSIRYGWPYNKDFSNGWLKPHPKCIEARVEAIKLTRNQHVALARLFDDGDDTCIDNEWIAGHEVQTYNQLVKKGVAKHLPEHSGYHTTFIGREYVRIHRKND